MMKSHDEMRSEDIIKNNFDVMQQKEYVKLCFISAMKHSYLKANKNNIIYNINSILASTEQLL